MIREGFNLSKESVDKLEIHKEPMDKLLNQINIEGYESPIDIVLSQIRMEQENGIFKAVQEQGVFVDKDELIKALRYDRGQYEKGYLNGYRAKASEVAEEIFAEIEDVLNHIGYFDEIDFNALKKKYTESESNNE